MVCYAGRYEKNRVLGSGSSGTVFHVRDVGTSQEYALKTLPTALLSHRDTEFFKAEFGVLKNLSHPNICKIYDAGHDAEKRCYYLVCEYVQGTDFFKATDNLNYDRVEELCVQALRAFSYLHQKSVIHLDVKPQNILVDDKGQLKIIDFGFANFHKREQPDKEKSSQSIIGSTAYVSPEMIKREKWDHRTDLYSLGATFYKIFTRNIPFEAQDMSAMHHRHLMDKPKIPSSINPGIPEYWDTIILKLLEKDPAKRYRYASDVIKDINFYTNKKYAVESIETRISYLPQQGELIARDGELEKFMCIYEDRIAKQLLNIPPYLVITGEKGTGKTRLLTEIKNIAKKNLIPILSWEESESIPFNEIKAPCIIWGDNQDFTPDMRSYIEIAFGRRPVLVVMASPVDSAQPDATIRLCNFTKSQVAAYLAAVTGLKDMPESIFDIIFSYTKGNPGALSEYTKYLLQKGVFKDSHGAWPKKILEDLGNDLAEMGVDSFTEKRISEELGTLLQNKTYQDILVLLALLHKTTETGLAHIHKLVVGSDHDMQAVEYLLAGMIVSREKNIYALTNPLYATFILKNSPLEYRRKCCDIIAKYYVAENMPAEVVLYYRGRGTDPHAWDALKALVEINKKNNRYGDTRDNLLAMLDCADVSKTMEEECLLQLGMIDVETGRYPLAEKTLEKIISKNDKMESTAALQALEQLGLVYARKNERSKALGCYNRVLELIENQPERVWIKINVKNRIARLAYNAGNIKEAETIYTETWQYWKDGSGRNDKIIPYLNELDLIYYDKGEFKRATDVLQCLLSTMAGKTWSQAYPVLLYRLAKCYIQMGELDLAEQTLKECIKIIRERQTPHWLYNVYNELGVLYVKKNNFSEALKNYERAFELAIRTQSGSDSISIAYNIATIYCMTHELEQAKKYYIHVVNNVSSSEKNKLLLTNHYMSLITLAFIYRQQDNIPNAAEYFKQASELFNKHSHLKPFAQYYWQEKAALHQMNEETIEAQEALSELEKLRTVPGFEKEEYEKWLRTLDIF